VAGGALGLGLGHVGVNALVVWSPAFVPRLPRGSRRLARARVHVDPLAVTGFVFGLVPALSVSRVDLHVIQGGRG
jgi:hypothetical protein